MKLEGKNITFQYDNGNRKILNKFSISVESGERVGLTAPSGFGKTTCCKILAGYEKPDSGEVLLDGKLLSQWKGYSDTEPDMEVPLRRSRTEAVRAFGSQPLGRPVKTGLHQDRELRTRLRYGAGFERSRLGRFMKIMERESDSSTVSYILAHG